MYYIVIPRTETRKFLSPPCRWLNWLTEQLTIQADAGSILISREDITARQAITTITHLYEVIDSLILQLVDASNEIVDVLDIPDPLETVDEELLDDLLECGANTDGLRLLLAVEDEADEE